MSTESGKYSAARRPTAIPWTDSLPNHWKEVRCRALFTILKRIIGREGPDIFSITQHGIRVKNVSENDGQLAQDYSKYQIVEPGDFAMNHMDLLTGYVDIASSFGVTSPDYRVFKTKHRVQVNDRYYLYLFQHLYRFKVLYGYGQGASQFGRWRLSTDQFYSLLLPLPPLEEQEAISEFLSQETYKIDLVMQKQERLIALLTEKRHAVICQAVTKGNNPGVPMRDSGIEWAGCIPAHWQTLAVGRLFLTGRGRVISHEDIAKSPGPYPVYSSQTENEGILGYVATYDFDGEYITWTTDGAKAGTVFHRTGKFNCTNVCGTLKPRALSRLDLNFCAKALDQATSEFVRHDINPKLMNNVMQRIKIPVPPVDEQSAIVSQYDERLEEYDILISKCQAFIELMKERRAALISAAVTGKIYVRKVA